MGIKNPQHFFLHVQFIWEQQYIDWKTLNDLIFFQYRIYSMVHFFVPSATQLWSVILHRYIHFKDFDDFYTKVLFKLSPLKLL